MRKASSWRDDAWQSLGVQLIGPCLLALLGLCVGLPLAFVLRTYWRVKRANERFLASARSAAVSSEGTAELSLRAETATQHAVWLELDVGGEAPSFLIDVLVTAAGVTLVSVRDLCGYDDGGDFVRPGPKGPGSPYAVALDTAKGGGLGGTRVQSTQRVALFTPRTGDEVSVRVRVTPQPHTTLTRARVLVTDRPEP